MYISTSPNWANQRQTSAQKVDRLRFAASRGWTPPPRISVPDWADRYRRLAKEAGSTSGAWRTSTVEIARGIMLAVTEPGTHIVTAMSCTQLVKTSLIENVFGYFAHLDPAPMLLVQPKEDAAEQFSKERITPLVKATPVLRDLVGTGKTRSSEETLLYKSFPGGFLALVGAGSPDNLARRPVRVTLFDEVDKYPVTREGEPIALGEERTATFGVNWLSVRACSPTEEGRSRIATSYAESDQRQASVCCPHCGGRLFLDFFKHVDWEKERDQQGRTVRHHPKTARIYCDQCGGQWSEGERLTALQTVQWHQTRPFFCCGAWRSPLDLYAAAVRDGVADPVRHIWDWWDGPRWAVHRAKCPSCGGWGVDNEHAGFQASKLYSPWQKDRPQDLAKKWLDAGQDEDRRQVFFNTQLGVPYTPKVGKDVRTDDLMDRREIWPGVVPSAVALLTAGVDTQDDRLEMEVIGWGLGEESWSIAYHVLWGDPDEPEVWARLDEILLAEYLRHDGMAFRVAATCVDSGGHKTQAAYAYCRERRGRKVWAIKGASEKGGQRSPVWPTGRVTRKRKGVDYRPVIIGTNAAKDRISSRLAIEAPGPGYMHFPAERGKEYFEQLTGERLVLKRVSGRPFRRWEPKPNTRTEVLDCNVYAYAALWGLMMDHKVDLDHEAKKVGAESAPVVRSDSPEGQRLAALKSDGIVATGEPLPELEKQPVRRRRKARSNYLDRIGR